MFVVLFLHICNLFPRLYILYIQFLLPALFLHLLLRLWFYLFEFFSFLQSAFLNIFLLQLLIFVYPFCSFYPSFILPQINQFITINPEFLCIKINSYKSNFNYHFQSIFILSFSSSFTLVSIFLFSKYLSKH
jgi:hypothetical protein